MKSNYHRDALDQALRIALGTAQPALRRQALTRAAAHLVHPQYILDSSLLTDTHPWRREALAVSDAFEAVTNGMEEPGLLEALENLEPDSPFQDWRHLVLAIHFFYEELDEAVTAHLERIAEDSPVYALACVLRSLVGDLEGLSSAQRRLSELLTRPDPLTVQWVQDIAEGLETGDEALFWGALTDWLEFLAPGAPARAQAAVLWVWNQLEWRDFDEEVLLDLGASLWGRAESYRLAALGTLPWDAEGAALLWARFVLQAARENTVDEATLHEARALLDKFRAAAESQNPSSEWREAWSHLAQAWNVEAMARGWNDVLIHSLVPVAVAAPAEHAGQLDLFA